MTNTQVTLNLVDFTLSSSLHSKLTTKFSHQCSGFAKWLRFRLECENNLQYLPIEFSEDLTMVSNVLTSSNRSLGIHLDRCCGLIPLWNYFFLLTPQSPHSVKNNAQLVLQNVKLRPLHFEYASNELKADKDFVRSICSQIDTSLLRYACDSLRSDRDFVREFFTPQSSILNSVSPELLQGRSVVLEALQKGCTLPFTYVPPDDEIKALANWWTLENALPEKLHDREFIMKCIKKSPFSFGKVVDELKMDCEFVQQVLEMICQEVEPGGLLFDPIGRIFPYLNEKQRACKELVLKVVPYSVKAYMMASEELKHDRDVVLAVVKNGASVLKSIPEAFKKDRQVVLEAITHDGCALEYVDDSLRNDKEIVKVAFMGYYPSFRFASIDLKNDKEFVLEVAKTTVGHDAYICWSEALADDKEFMLECVKINGTLISGASQRLRSDRDVMLEAFRQDVISLRFCENLNLELMLEIVKEKGRALLWMDTTDENIHMEAAKQDGYFSSYVEKDLFERMKKERMETCYQGCDIPNRFLIPNM